MNEEVIKKLTKAKDCTNPHSLYGRCPKNEYDYEKGFKDAIDFALGVFKELDKSEKEKPVLSEAEDEWLKGLQIFYPMRSDQIYIVARQGWGYDFEYRVADKEYRLSYEPYKSKECTDYVKIRLLNAIIYGYTVNKEKRYIVEIPNNVEGQYTLLFKNHEGKIILGNFDNEACKNYPNVHLTEDEIKKDFEWTLQLKFAKEVVEDE